MSAMTRLASRTLTAGAVGVSVVVLAAGVSAYAAPAAAPARPATCHIDWFTHPWDPGFFGASVSISTTRAFPNWLLGFGFRGSERVTSFPAGPIDWWYQAGPVVAVKGDSQLRNLPAGDNVLQLPLIVKGAPAGTPWFTLNGRPCSVSASTAITPTTTTAQPPTTATTTTSPPSSTTTTPWSGTTSTSSYPQEGCTYSYYIEGQSRGVYTADLSVNQVGGFGLSDQVIFVFSADQQVTNLSPSAAPSATWTQTGRTVTVGPYPSGPGHSLWFRATYTSPTGLAGVSSGADCSQH